jgi:hypothetical protein
VGELPWGSHLCLFYETEQDLYDILVPYFKTGLENKEFCLWVIPEPVTVHEARNELRKRIPDIDGYLAEGSLELIRQEDWFLDGGQLDLHRIIGRVQEKLTQGLARGYRGMRLNGTTAWLQRQAWKDFQTFEAALDEAIAGQPLIVLCTFPLGQAGATDMLDAARTHLFAGALRNGSWQVLETPELRLAKQELQTLSGELVEAVRRGALGAPERPGERGRTSRLTPGNVRY